MPESGVEQTLYQCPRCTVQWAGPETDDDRLCECGNTGLCDDVELKAVGTVETEEPGWQRLGPTAERLQEGFGIRYESIRCKRTHGGHFSDLDTEDDPVPGQILGVEETRFGPRYEVIPDTDWWYPEEGVEEPVPTEHCWHWEIDEVTERTRASVRLEEIRQNLDDEDDGLRADGGESKETGGREVPDKTVQEFVDSRLVVEEDAGPVSLDELWEWYGNHPSGVPREHFKWHLVHALPEPVERDGNTFDGVEIERSADTGVAGSGGDSGAE